MISISFPSVEATIELDTGNLGIQLPSLSAVKLFATKQELPIVLAKDRLEQDDSKTTKFSPHGEPVGLLRLEPVRTEPAQGAYQALDGWLAVTCSMKNGHLSELLHNIFIIPCEIEELRGLLLPTGLLIQVSASHLIAQPKPGPLTDSAKDKIGLLIRRNKDKGAWEWCVPRLSISLQKRLDLSPLNQILERAVRLASGMQKSGEFGRFPEDGVGCPPADRDTTNVESDWQLVDECQPIHFRLRTRDSVLQYPVAEHQAILLRPTYVVWKKRSNQEQVLELVEERGMHEAEAEHQVPSPGGSISIRFQLPIPASETTAAIRLPTLVNENQNRLPVLPVSLDSTQTSAQSLWFPLEDGWLHVCPPKNENPAPSAWPLSAITHESRNMECTGWLVPASMRSINQAGPGFRCWLLLDNSGTKRLRFTFSQHGNDQHWETGEPELQIDEPAVQFETAKQVIGSDQLTAKHLPPLDAAVDPPAKRLVMQSPCLVTTLGQRPPWMAQICLSDQELPSLCLLAASSDQALTDTSTVWLRAAFPLVTPLAWAQNDPSAQHSPSPLRSLIPIQLASAPLVLEPTEGPFRLLKPDLSQARWSPIANGAVLRGCDVPFTTSPIDSSLLGIEVQLPQKQDLDHGSAEVRLRYAVSVLDELYSSEELLPKGQRDANASDTSRLMRSHVKERFSTGVAPISIQQLFKHPLMAPFDTPDARQKPRLIPDDFRSTANSQHWTCTLQIQDRPFATLFTERMHDARLASVDRVSVLPWRSETGEVAPLQIAGIPVHPTTIRVAAAPEGKQHWSIDFVMLFGTGEQDTGPQDKDQDFFTIQFVLDEQPALGTCKTTPKIPAEHISMVLTARTLSGLMTNGASDENPGSYRLLSVQASAVTVNKEGLVATEQTIWYQHREMVLFVRPDPADELQLHRQDSKFVAQIASRGGAAALEQVTCPTASMEAVPKKQLSLRVSSDQIPGLSIAFRYSFPGTNDLCCDVRPGGQSSIKSVSVKTTLDHVYLAWAGVFAVDKLGVVNGCNVDNLTRLFLELRIDPRKEQPCFSARHGLVGWKGIELFGLNNPRANLSLVLSHQADYLELNGIWRWDTTDETQAHKLSIQLLAWDARFVLSCSDGSYHLECHQKQLLARYELSETKAGGASAFWLVPQSVTFDFPNNRLGFKSRLALSSIDREQTTAPDRLSPPNRHQVCRRPGISVTFDPLSQQIPTEHDYFVSVQAQRSLRGAGHAPSYAEASYVKLDFARGLRPTQFQVHGPEIVEQQRRLPQTSSAQALPETDAAPLLCNASDFLMATSGQLAALVLSDPASLADVHWEGTTAIEMKETSAITDQRPSLWLLRDAELNRILITAAQQDDGVSSDPPRSDSSTASGTAKTPDEKSKLATELLAFSGWHGVAVQESWTHDQVSWTLLDSPLLMRSDALTFPTDTTAQRLEFEKELCPTAFVSLDVDKQPNPPTTIQSLQALSVARLSQGGQRIDGRWTPPFVLFRTTNVNKPLDPTFAHEHLLIRREIPFELYGKKSGERTIAQRGLPWFLGRTVTKQNSEPFSYPSQHALFKLAAPRPGERTHYQFGLVRLAGNGSTLQVTPMTGGELRTPRSQDSQQTFTKVELEQLASPKSSLVARVLSYQREHPECYVFTDEKPVALGVIGPGPVFLKTNQVAHGSVILDTQRCLKLLEKVPGARLVICKNGSSSLKLGRMDSTEDLDCLFLTMNGDAVQEVLFQVYFNKADETESLQVLIIDKQGKPVCQRDLNCAPSQPIQSIQEDTLPPALPDLVGIVRSTKEGRVLAGYGPDHSSWILGVRHADKDAASAGSNGNTASWQKSGCFVDKLAESMKPTAYTIFAISPDGSCSAVEISCQ